MEWNKLRASIIARQQNLMANHFELTKYGKCLKKFKNKYKGQRCFIVGNGPSLNERDLQVLYENNVVSFGTNRVFNIFEKTEWRPTYYVSEDILLMKDVQGIIADMPVDARFIPINLKWFEGVNIKNAEYFWMDYSSELEETYGLSIDIPHCIRCRGTVTVTCLQIALYMGFSKIYLIGVDHNFAKMFYDNGRVVVDNSIKNHFVEEYDKGIFDQGFHVDNATRAYADVERLSRKLKNCKIYNATRGGKLEVFERIQFETIFEGGR